MNYEQQANDFAKAHGVKLSVLSAKYGQMPNWNNSTLRWIFKLRLTRGRRRYTFVFGQSVHSDRKKPTMYDVLSCLTKYNPGTFEDFCADYDYDTYSRRAERIYKAVCREWKAVERLFGDIIEELQEIQ